MMDNIDVRNTLLNDSDSVFLIDEKTGISFSYKALLDSACSIGGFLQTFGLKKGDRLVVMMDNSVMLAKIYFACLYAGVTVVPVNPSWTKEQVLFVLADSNAKVLLTTSQYQNKIEENHVSVVVADDYADQWEQHTKINPLDYLQASNVAIIVYTSGTTSQPKGVIHTVGNLVGNGTLFINTLGITEKNRFYNILPMTYLGGYYNLLLIPCLSKGSVVISNAFNAQTIVHFWDGVIKNEINTLWLVPTMIAILMQMDRNQSANSYCKENILLVLTGTAPLSTKLKNEFEKKYAVSICENYALSETLFLTTQRPVSSAISRAGVGELLDGIELKIIDDEGSVLPTGEEGEIVVSTPFAMNRYLGVEGSFDKSRDKSFLTGDLGYFDENGRLHISGRKKDLIIKGGVNISPAAIEEVIGRHQQVLQCAVVGIPHPLSGEEVAAVVKIKEDVSFDVVKKELIEICRQSLSAVQQPAEIIMLEELPHTYTGKIQKAKLRAWLVDNKNKSLKTKDKETIINETNYYKPSGVVENCGEAVSIAYNTMVYELQSKNVDVTVLSLGEAFFDIPLFDFNLLPLPASYHYSHSRGIPKLRKVLAEYFLNQYDVKFNPDNEIIITAGSKVAIYMTLMAVINPGDEVIIHDPAWVSFPEQVKLCHGIPIQVPYYESVYDFEKYITNRTKLLIVNNPNNPRGSVFTLDEIAHLYKLAEKYKLFILSDEAYSDFVVNKEQFISIGNFDKDLKFSIICNSISKNFGISGWRIGYVIANKLLINQILKLNQHLITCPATILEYYIAENFYEILKYTKPQIVELMSKRKKIVDYMQKIGLSCLDGDTTFYIFLSIEKSDLRSDEFCRRLLDQYRICVVPGIGYGKSCDHHVRVSIGTESIERIFSALDKIKELILSTSMRNKLNLTQREHPVSSVLA